MGPVPFRLWPYASVVVSVAAVAGVLVAGGGSGDRFVLASASSTQATSTTEPSAESGAEADLDRTDTTSTDRPTAVARTASEVDDKEQPSSTASSTTTSTTGAIEPASVVRTVRVVLANASGDPALSEQAADTLAANGYDEVRITEARDSEDAIVIYYASGFREEAVALAGALSVFAPLELMPTADPTVDGSASEADLLVVLG